MTNNWRQVKIGEFCRIRRGGSPRPISDFITDAEDGVPWLKIGDIDQKSKYIYRTSEKIIKEGVAKSTLVHKGDFILSNSMSFGRPYIMKITSCIHDGWLTLQNIDKNLIDQVFLYYLLLHPKTQYEFQILSAGSGVKNLKKETVSEVPLLLPPLSEQEKIVEVLTTWDEYLEKLDGLIAAKRELKKGLMQELLTGKRRLPGFNGDWKEVRVSKLGDFYTGLSGLTKENFGHGLGKYVQYKQIFDRNTIDISKLGIVDVENSSTQNKVRKGDIFFTTSSETPYEVGYSSVILEDVENLYLNSFSFAMRPNIDLLNPKFASFYLRGYNFRKKVTRLAQGSTRFNLSKNSFKKIKISLPPLPEQQAIAEILSTADAEIDALVAKREAIALERKYLLENLVTGKIRVV